MDPQRARLQWHCRRGMKELDLLLREWLDRFYDSAADPQRQLFARLLELPDPVLAACLLGQERARDPALQQMVAAVAGRHPLMFDSPSS